MNGQMVECRSDCQLMAWQTYYLMAEWSDGLMIGWPNGPWNGLMTGWSNKLNKGLVHQSWKANGAPSRSDV